MDYFRQVICGWALGFAMLPWQAVAAEPAAAAISGAGGSSVLSLITAWGEHYQRDTGIAVHFANNGSGGGIGAVQKGQVDFGASEKPLMPYDLYQRHLFQFPVVAMGFVAVVNLPGIQPAQLTLDEATLCGIFLGTIKYWDDPMIGKINPGLALAHLAVQPVNRLEPSGTTFTLTNYLSKVDLRWLLSIGDGLNVVWPTGTQVEGTSKVAARVAETPGAIGLVEYGVALKRAMTYTDLINRRGKRVSPGPKSFASALDHADFEHAENFYVLLTNQGGDASWPLTATGYILLRVDALSTNRRAWQFFSWVLNQGQEDAVRLNYLPLSPAVVVQIEKAWQREREVASGPLFQFDKWFH